MADRTVTVRLRALVSDYAAKMTAASRATQDLERKVVAARGVTAEGYRRIGQAGLVAGGLVAAGFGLAVKAATDFDAKMALVRTLSKASTADMAQLRSAALTVGQAYGYSAGQVADAQAELVKAGLSVKDILGGALVGALTLASAAQMNVADATTIAATAMTQFGLSGKDVPHIADLLASGADKALGSAQDLGYALDQSGVTAHQFGLSIDETVGTLASFAEAGQVGERGGTVLTQMLLKLSAASGASQKILDHLGISLYDTSGRFVGMAGLAGQLQTKMSGLTDAERNHDMAVIFGQRAIRGANILYQEGAAGIENWTRKVNDAGFAELQSSGKMNNLAGDWRKFEVALGAASVKAGEVSQGPLRGLVQDATSVVKVWSDMPGPVRGGMEALLLAGGAVSLVGGAALIAVPKIAALNVSLEDMGLSAITARGALGALGKMTLVAGVVVGVGEAVNALDNAVKPAGPDVDKLTGSLVSLGQTGQVKGELFKTFGANLRSFNDQVKILQNSGFTKPTHWFDKLSPANIGGDIAHAVHLPTGWDQTFTNKQKFQQAQENVQGLDKALAQVAQQTGGLDTARQAWSQLSQTWLASGGNINDLVKLFPQFASEIQNQANATGNASTATGGLTSQLDALTKQTKDAAKAAQAYSDKIHAASDPLFAMNQALQDLHAKQKAATAAVDKYGPSSHQAKQANLDLASSMITAQAAATTLAGAVKSGAVSIDNAKSMLHAFVSEGHLTKSQAHEILGVFNNLIGTAKTLNRQRPHLTVTADTTNAEYQLEQLQRALAALHNKTVTVKTLSSGTNISTDNLGRVLGHAAGGAVADGLFTVGEQGPELGFKSGGRVEIFSNQASKRAGIPGFAGGSGANVETRLRAIMSNRGSTPQEIARAIDALQRLSDTWSAVLQRASNRQGIRQAQHAVNAAGTPAERLSAEKQLAQLRKQQEQADITARISRAQDLAKNREAWRFEHMSITQQIAYYTEAMAKEKRFSDQWLSDAEARRQLRQSQKQDLAGNKAQWQFENMSAQQQVAYLDKKIAKEKKYSDQWLADMEQRKSLVDQMASSTSTTPSTVAASVPNQPGTPPDLAHYATGGLVTGGGTGTSDSIYARLSNGEYVIPAGMAAKYRPALDAMRSGTYMAAGGGGGDLHVHVHAGHVYGADQRAIRNLGKQLLPVIREGLGKHQQTAGPLGLS